MVDPRVLIPRPETEQVVDAALCELDRWRSQTNARANEETPVADLGTGSGAIALSIATERSSARVWATDSSPAALAVARANLASAGRAATRVRLARGSWFEALPGSLRGALGLVVSNPPYVAEGEVAGLPREVADWEPLGALVAGPTGVECLRLLLEQAPRWLARGGSVVLEMAPHQRAQVEALARAAGFGDVEVVDDLSGRARAVVGRL